MLVYRLVREGDMKGFLQQIVGVPLLQCRGATVSF